MTKKRVRKNSGAKCPKCRAKLEVSEFAEKCRRCGYTKNLEPSNLMKRFLNYGGYGMEGWI